MHQAIYCNALYQAFMNGLLVFMTIIVFTDVSASMFPTSYYTLYGSCLCVYGIDVVLTALVAMVSSKPIPHSRQTGYIFQGLLTNCTFLAPFIWGFAMVDLLFRDPNGGGEMWGHYVTPALIVLRSEFLWGSVTTFKDAVLGAEKVIYLLVVVLLVTAANSVVLMKGQYKTGDFYTDNQYETFVNALSTMFVFVLTGENYVEAITASLQDNYAFIYMSYFAICTVLGMSPPPISLLILILKSLS